MKPPSPPAPSPATPTVTTPTSDTILGQWAQCGGKSGCSGANCLDGPWPGTRCLATWKCVRSDAWWYACQPGENAVITNPPSGGGNNGGTPPANVFNPANYTIPPAEPALKTSTGDYNYGQVIKLSLMFYEAQRAGKLPSTNRIKWRADSGTLDLAPDGRDVTKGWYDAGDNVRFNLPMAWSVGALAWSVVEFKEGYEKANQLAEVMDQIKWVTDYFINCVGNGTSIVVQVGNGNQDHAVWNRPEAYKTAKPVYAVTPSAPGSDAVGAMAGALAASSQMFASADPAYSAQLLSAAIKAYKFAGTYLGRYSDSVPDANNFYRSSNYYDDLAWAAAWLAIRTGSETYKAEAKQWFDKFLVLEDAVAYVWNNYDWDSNSWGAAVLVSRLHPSYAAPKQRLNNFADAWLNGKGLVKFTPKGFAFSGEWGSLRHIGNALLLMQAYARGGSDATLARRVECFSHKQLRLILGESGRSFVVGYGKNPPQQPHHRAASCPPLPYDCLWDAYQNPGPNWHTLYGALVGGPSGDDTYSDLRSNFIQNEVATDYNAGFTGALAAMVQSGSSYAQC